jgi:hypothetical protein
MSAHQNLGSMVQDCLDLSGFVPDSVVCAMLVASRSFVVVVGFNVVVVVVVVQHGSLTPKRCGCTVRSWVCRSI